VDVLLEGSTRELTERDRGTFTAGVRPETSTVGTENRSAVEEAVTALMTVSAPEELEPGIDTPLIPALYDVVRTHGADAVFELAASIESSEMDPQLASWVLRWLGRLPDHSTSGARRWLLERGLQSSVPMIRDGAAAGLASLGDPRVLSMLRAAADRERYSRIQRTIGRAIQQIERFA
jgi:hypothetical protein